MKTTITLFSILLVFTQCKKETPKNIVYNNKTESTVKYAKGFDIVEKNGIKTLVIKKVFQNTSNEFYFSLGSQTNIANQQIKIPVQKLVVTSTSHIPMLELLGAEKNLVGFPNTKYISSLKTRALITNGVIIDLGSEQDMNTEKLIDLNPDLVVGFSLHSNNKLYENIEKNGIPVIFNGDWLEETPLGRAEWLKFFGVLLDKEKEADSIFKSIETEYLKVKKLAKQNTNIPTVLSGAMFKDIWNVPAGKSFTSTFFKDANLNYLWKDTKGTGSLPLNFESVLDKAENAEYWINCGLFENKKQLLKANNNYQEFNALNTNKTYTIGKRKGPTGGLIYFENSPVRPDLVLKDIIKITQPESLPNYQLTFFNRMN